MNREEMVDKAEAAMQRTNPNACRLFYQDELRRLAEAAVSAVLACFDPPF